MANFRGLLLDLSNSLTTSDLGELKYICREEIPPGRAEKITRPFEFFAALEQLNLLSEENREFLAAKLIAINRTDVRNKLLGIQGGQIHQQQNEASSEERLGIHNAPASDQVIHDIVEDLSTSWKMLGRRLDLPENVLRNIDAENHRVVEKGVAMFTTWKERKGELATVEALRKGLEKIGRRDLSEKVRDIVNSEQETSATAVEHECTGRPVEESQPLPCSDDVGRHMQQPRAAAPQPQEQAEARSIHQPSVLRPPVEQRPFPRLDDLDPSHLQSSENRSVLGPQLVISTVDAYNATVLNGSASIGQPQPPEQDVPDHGPDNTTTTTPVQVQSAEDSILDPEKYELVKLIGSGGFAKVYLCIKKSTQERWAVKMVDLKMNDHGTQEQVKAVTTEVKILSAIRSDYIVKFFYTEEYQNNLLIFLEFMPGGSIEKLIKDKGAIEEPTVQKFTWQILKGVEFLHNSGIIHRDIKGGNILLDDAQENIKIADFGISKIMNRLVTATGGLKTSSRVIASFFWTSPELLSNKEFSRNTDIWSVGCTVVEMLTAFPPLVNQDLDHQQAMCKILFFDIRPPDGCSSQAYGFLEKCFSPRDKRPSATELLENDPFTQSDSSE